MSCGESTVGMEVSYEAYNTFYLFWGSSGHGLVHFSQRIAGIVHCFSLYGKMHINENYGFNSGQHGK